MPEAEYSVRVRDVARITGEKSRTVNGWCATGKIPCIKPGRKWLIRVDWELVLAARARDRVEERENANG